MGCPCLTRKAKTAKGCLGSRLWKKRWRRSRWFGKETEGDGEEDDGEDDGGEEVEREKKDTRDLTGWLAVAVGAFNRDMVSFTAA